METHLNSATEESTDSGSNYNHSRQTYDRLRYYSSDSESKDLSGGTLHIDLDMFIRRRQRSPSISICSSTNSNTTVNWLNLEVNSITSLESQFNVPSLAENPNAAELSKTVTNKGLHNGGYVKKGTWTPEEDLKLRSYIMRYGAWNWAEIPKFAGLARTGNSCRLRWNNYLRPGLKRGKFSGEEERISLLLHQAWGNRITWKN